MKSKEKKQLEGKTIGELRADFVKAKSALADLVLDKAQGKLKNTSSLSNTRRDMAVIATLMRQQELAAQEK